MAQHRRQAQCANTKMPEGLTEELRTRLSQLKYSAKALYLQQEVFSKFVSADTDAPEVRRARAIFKWLCAERDNEATNDRLILTPDGYQILPRVSYRRFMSFCQTTILGIIGEVPPIEALIGSFSGGASTSRPRTESHPATKYLGKADVTRRGLQLFSEISDEMPGWLGQLVEELTLNPCIVPGNVMFTVPKKADIDRVCCKEPDLNMFVQKGIGNYLRSCLRRVGINLNEQANNRSFARTGSLTGGLATFDLSNASDSMTRELVSQMLPVFWHTLLDSVRSPVTIIDGEEHPNHMFSSMGNGFTFELESLLFYTLTRAIAYFRGSRGVVSIYGDDIICPSDIADVLPSVFNYFGFQVNTEKSHTGINSFHLGTEYVGTFRESCGGHYLDGRDITPFYVKAPIATLVDVIHVANKLREWAGIEGYKILDPEVEDLWFWLSSFVPKQFWGGWDTSFKYQLVSPERDGEGGHRLSEKASRQSTGNGGYFHWLNTTWDRETMGDAVSTSSLTKPLNKFRVRRSLRPVTVAPLSLLFPSEIG